MILMIMLLSYNIILLLLIIIILCYNVYDVTMFNTPIIVLYHNEW